MVYFFPTCSCGAVKLIKRKYIHSGINTNTLTNISDQY